jgi:hypothetical protein
MAKNQCLKTSRWKGMAMLAHTRGHETQQQRKLPLTTLKLHCHVIGPSALPQEPDRKLAVAFSRVQGIFPTFPSQFSILA